MPEIRISRGSNFLRKICGIGEVVEGIFGVGTVLPCTDNEAAFTEVIIADGGLMHADAVGRTFDIGAEHADVIKFALRADGSVPESVV